MRILVFCPQQLWPLNSGARLRNFHLANALAQKFPVTIVQLLSPGETAKEPEFPTSFERIASFVKDASYTPRKILQGLMGPVPISVLNYSSRAVSRQLSELLRAGSFDAVQVESIHLFKYVETIRSAPNRPKILMDWHNVESELMWRYAEQTKGLPKRAVARRTAGLLERVELKSLSACDLHTVVSERERQELLKRDGDAVIHVIPNGVDTAFYAWESAQTAEKEAHGSCPTLLFVGSMDYHANIDAVSWFVQDVWPMLAREFPTLEFTIVGRNPSAFVQALASARVHVTGTVDDVRPFYSHAFAVIVPLRVGGGTRLKILEAMAAGVPVISTRLGAEGLSVEDNRHILLADSREQVAFAVKSLLQHPKFRSQLTEAARALVVNQYDWVGLGRRLMGVYSDLVQCHGIS